MAGKLKKQFTNADRAREAIEFQKWLDDLPPYPLDEIFPDRQNEIPINRLRELNKLYPGRCSTDYTGLTEDGEKIKLTGEIFVNHVALVN